MDQQILVILDEGQTASLPQVLAICRNHQAASGRVLALECPAAELARLQALSGITVITDPNQPLSMEASLTTGESLFVAGWRRRIQEAQTKQRPGDTLPWDAPGFTPPDAPTPKSQSSAA